MALTTEEQLKEFDKIGAEVAIEIKTLGDDQKSNFIEMNKRYDELKILLVENQKNLDPLLTERIDKLSADILTRQQTMDVEMNTRVDKMEVAFQRLPKSGSDSNHSARMAEARQFKMDALICQKRLTRKGVKDADVNIEEFDKYKKSFDPYLKEGIELMDPDQRKDLSVGIDPDGGFTVTPKISNRITERAFEIDPIRQLARTEKISTDAWEEEVSFDEAGAEWGSETASYNPTEQPPIKMKRIPAHILRARPRATTQVLEDSSRDLESWLGNKVAERFGRVEGIAFIGGDGVDRPRGILTYPNVAVAGTPEFGKIEQINMGAPAALTTEGLIDVQYSLVESVMNLASWLANRLTVRDIMKLKDGDGLFIWRPGLTESQPATLLGQPIRMSTTMPVVAANALSIAFADWRGAYVIVDRLGVSVLRNPFIDPPWVVFYTRKRVGGDVIGFDKIKIGKVAQ